jgi:hypothetical protein
MNEELIKRLIGNASENDFFKNKVLWNSGGVIFHKEDMIRLIELVMEECQEVVCSSDPSPKMILHEPYRTIVDNITEHFYGEEDETL